MMRVLIGCAGLFAAVPVPAAVIFDLPAATGPLLSPGDVSVSFGGRAGDGWADFRITGFASLDGDGNGYTDVFTLNLNGTDIFSGSFDLGGGGRNIMYFGAPGSRFSAATPGMWQGGVADMMIPLRLATGPNTLNFRYNGNAQGRSDEAWGIERLTVAGDGTGAVPEPATWAMLITGFGFVGAALRSRRRQSTQSSPESR